MKKKLLLIAIGLGGFVSVTILLTGTAISETFSFEGLADALSGQLGGWAPWLLAAGLFGAGISSALTAALAASVTAQSLLSKPGDTNWAENRLRFRAISHITGFELLDQTLILTVSVILFLILMIPALKNIFSANS